LAPLRILSIRVAARRSASSTLGPYDIRPPAWTHSHFERSPAIYVFLKNQESFFCSRLVLRIH
jgi:hypothetical protein